MQISFPSLFPSRTPSSLNLRVQEANQVEKRIKQLYKHLAKTRAQPRHIPVLMGKCWQAPRVRCPRILGASARTRGLMGKMETESWPASKPQDTTTKPLHFRRLVFCGGSELRMHNYKNEMFQTSYTPTAFFLLFTVLGGRIYFVS